MALLFIRNAQTAVMFIEILNAWRKYARPKNMADSKES
jgi:hypothetical protein